MGVYVFFGVIGSVCVWLGEWISREIQIESEREGDRQGARGQISQSALQIMSTQLILFTNYH